jgi:hypothetical protein
VLDAAHIAVAYLVAASRGVALGVGYGLSHACSLVGGGAAATSAAVVLMVAIAQSKHTQPSPRLTMSSPRRT